MGIDEPLLLLSILRASDEGSLLHEMGGIGGISTGGARLGAQGAAAGCTFPAALKALWRPLGLELSHNLGIPPLLVVVTAIGVFTKMAEEAERVFWVLEHPPRGAQPQFPPQHEGGVDDARLLSAEELAARLRTTKNWAVMLCTCYNAAQEVDPGGLLVAGSLLAELLQGKGKLLFAELHGGDPSNDGERSAHTGLHPAPRGAMPLLEPCGKALECVMLPELPCGAALVRLLYALTLYSFATSVGSTCTRSRRRQPPIGLQRGWRTCVQLLSMHRSCPARWRRGRLPTKTRSVSAAAWRPCCAP